MTDKEVERLIKRLMAFLRDMHVELKAQQRVLLGLELTPAEVQQRIRNVKKTFPTIKTQTRRAAGPDFTPDDLQKLESVARFVGRLMAKGKSIARASSV